MVESLLSLIVCTLCLELFGLCFLKQYCIYGMKSSGVHFLYPLERILLFYSCIFLWSFAFASRYRQLCVMTAPHSLSFCILQYSLCKMIVGFSNEICEYSAASIQFSDSVRRHPAGLGFHTCLMTALVLGHRKFSCSLLPRISIFSLLVLINCV